MITQLTDDESAELRLLEQMRRKDTRQMTRMHYLEIKRLALEFRFGERYLASAFYDFIETRGIRQKSAILLSADNWDEDINSLFGEILTQDERFYKFDLEISEAGDQVVECIEWEDVTEKRNLGFSNKGVPKSYYRLAIEVLRDINNDQGE